MKTEDKVRERIKELWNARKRRVQAEKDLAQAKKDEESGRLGIISVIKSVGKKSVIYEGKRYMLEETGADKMDVLSITDDSTMFLGE